MIMILIYKTSGIILILIYKPSFLFLSAGLIEFILSLKLPFLFIFNEFPNFTFAEFWRQHRN
jgi:hypothetical protein